MPGAFDDLIPGGAPDRTPPPQPGGFRPVFQAPADPFKQSAESRAREDQARENAKFGVSVNADQRDTRNTAFDNETSLRKEFTGRKEVADFQTVLPQIATAMKLADNPNASGADDLNIIYTFGKVMDPGSVVREGELALASGTGSFADSIEGAISKIMSGEKMPPEVRRKLVESMRRRGIEMSKSYGLTRKEYEELAQRKGIDPRDIVGGHPALPFQQAEADFADIDVYTNGQVSASPQRDPNDPSGAFPGGIAFGDDAQPKTGYRMAPEKQAAYEAFVKSQLGNPNASLDSLNGFLTAIGEQPVPNDERAAAFIESLKSGKISGGVDYSANDAAQRADNERRQKEREGQIVDPIGRGFGAVATLEFQDEINAAANTIIDGGTYQENLYDERLTDRADEVVNPYLRLGGQLAGALILPSGIGRAAAQGGVRAGAVRAGQEGAAFGGAYGFGSGEDMQSRGTNALLGAVTGGAVGYGAGRALPAAANALGGVTQGTRNALAQFMPQRAAETARRQGFAVDAASQGVDLMPADVGGAMVKRFTAGAAQAPASAERVRQASTRTNDQIGEAVGRQAQATGQPLAADEAGEIARKGAEVFTAQTRARASKLYDKAQQASKGVRIKPKGAVQAIDEEIARLSEAEAVNRPLIGELKKFRESLAQSGGISVSGLRDVRSTAGKAAYTEALRATPAQATFARIQDAIAKDVEAGLTAVGRPDALRLFQTADKLWKERIQAIDEVLEPVLGKAKSGEQVLSAIEGMAQGKGGGVNRLSRLMAALPKDEAANVTATIIERMGRATAGTQNAAGDAFSAGTFLTNWGKMSVKGKAILFRDQELRANLDAIARLSDAVKDTQRFANTSNTAGATIAQPTVGGFIALIPQNLMGRLLTSKGFTGWLARTPKFQNAGAQKAYVTRLEKIAAREPVHSAEIIQLKDYLANRIAQSPQQAAADVGGDQGDGRKKPPEQQR